MLAGYGLNQQVLWISKCCGSLSNEIIESIIHKALDSAMGQFINKPIFKITHTS